MYELLIRETKSAPINGINAFEELFGPYFIKNHKWKILVQKASRDLSGFGNETLINGPELYDLLKGDIKFISASFSALEGSQIVFRITAGNEWIIHTNLKHWVEFFEEKCDIVEKEELDSDLPEFKEFMQD